MRNYMTAFVLVLGLIPLQTLAQTSETSPRRTISVSGEGEISVPPDMAIVSIGVRMTAENAADAMDKVSGSSEAVLAKITSLGVAETDVQTTGIQLSPRYAQTVLGNTDYSQITSYDAYNTVTVKVRDLDALGGLLADVVGEGANALNGVSFGLQDPETVQDDARRAAVADARRLAQLYADAADVTLGDVLQLNENGSSGYQPYDAPVMAEMSMSTSSMTREVPVAPGEITLRSNVTMIYLLN